MIFYPTCHCFDDALDFLSHRMQQDSRDEWKLILVHAIVLSPTNYQPPDVPYAHAWVEEGQLVWEAGLWEGERVWYSVNKDEHHANFRPQKMSRYSMKQAMTLNAVHKHYGPWRKDYQDLCGQGILPVIRHDGLGDVVQSVAREVK